MKIHNLKPQYVTDETGKKTGVILRIEDYESLIQDMEDLAVAAERKDEPTVSHDEVKAGLKSDGLL